MRMVLRVSALVVMAVAGVWAHRVMTGGGISVVLAGHLVRSHDPWRPLIVAAVGAAVFVLAGGIPVAVRTGRRAWRVLLAAPLVARRVPPRVVALVLATVVFIVGAVYSTTAAGGADASGYVSLADKFLHGGLKPAQPWVGQVPWPNPRWSFSPLGWIPVDDAPPFGQAPIYSPGLPLLMALGKLLAGQTALFLVVPLCGALTVLATYGTARRLGTPATGIAAAWFLATSPLLLFQQIFPMSDVPVAAFWIAACFLLLGERTAETFAAGLCAGIAVLIRPNLFFLVPIMSLWFLLRQPRSLSFGRRVADGAIFGAGAAPAVIFLGGFYNYLFGSPFQSGYGGFLDWLDRSNIAENARLYFDWGMHLQPTFIVLGAVGLFLPMWVWRKNSVRAVIVFALMVMAITAEYLAYGVFDGWPFLRFFLPAWPLLAVGAGGVVVAVCRRVPVALGVVGIAAVIGVGLVGIQTARDREAFDLWHAIRRYTAASTIASEITPANSVVFSMEYSGALRYYSGRVPIRYDQVPEDWLDRSIEWLAASGVHAYAVMDDLDVARFRERFASQAKVHAVDTPIAVYQAWHQGARVSFMTSRRRRPLTQSLA